LVGKLNLKFLSREAGNQEEDPVFIIRFVRESSEDSVYDTSVLMDILLFLPGSAMTTLGLAWLTTIAVRRWRPASQQASFPVRKSLER
jgi:hypothetical protein